MDDGYSTAGYIKAQTEAQRQIAAQLTRIADALEAQYLLTLRAQGNGLFGPDGERFVRLHSKIVGDPKTVRR